MKQLAIAALWAYAFWYLGSMLASIAGVPDVVGPVLGLAAAAIVVLDPRRAIRRSPARSGWSTAS